MTLKGVSTSSTTSLRREDKNKPLEDTTLQQIAQEIASNSKLELNYEVSFEVKVDRADQILTPDLPYLQSLCTKQGVMLKVTDGKLVLFEEKNYEQKEAIASFDILQDSRVLSYQFSQNTSDTVNSIDYNYTDPKSGQQISQNFSIPNPPPTGQKLVINSRPSDMRGDAMRTAIINNEEAETVEVGSYKDISQISLDTDLTTNRSDLLGQAQREALGQARAKNKQEWIGSLELIGNTLMVAGVTVNIANAGVYSGQYMVDEATHTVSGGYKTSIKIHRVLQGY
jgi:phage protein D